MVGAVFVLLGGRWGERERERGVRAVLVDFESGMDLPSSNREKGRYMYMTFSHLGFSPA